jgi:hypothetical protein
MNCARCDSTGFLNIEQVPEGIVGDDLNAIQEWAKTSQSDVGVCDCCGDGSGWYGEPGQHYGVADPIGRRGPYAYNGGLCECH